MAASSRRACSALSLLVACAPNQDGESSHAGGAGGAVAGAAGAAGSGAGATANGGSAGSAPAAGSAGASSGAAGASGVAGANAAGTAGASGGAGGTASGAAGTAGDGGAASGGATSGGAGATAGTESAGGSAGETAGGAGAGGAPGSCDDPSLVICEDFESVADGAVPNGWTQNGSVGVVGDEAHRGQRSLRSEGAPNGQRRMTLSDARVAALGGTHWGRVFYRVQTPAPRPASGVLHSTLVAGGAESPIGGTIEVRVVDTVEDAAGNHQYLFNVQPDGRGEFGRGSSYDYQYDGQWHCTEWFVDHASQAYRFFVDGAEISQIAVSNGAGNFENAEIPERFTSLSVGWNNYQTAPDGGFVAWFDDLALGPDKIGCE